MKNKSLVAWAWGWVEFKGAFIPKRTLISRGRYSQPVWDSFLSQAGVTVCVFWLARIFNHLFLVLSLLVVGRSIVFLIGVWQPAYILPIFPTCWCPSLHVNDCKTRRDTGTSFVQVKVSTRLLFIACLMHNLMDLLTDWLTDWLWTGSIVKTIYF